MTKQSTKLALWDSVNRTDPDYTKGYKGPGGFTGTAINSIYLVRKATERWGPLGIGWGYEILEDRIDQGAPIAHKDGDRSILSDHHHTIHTIKLKLWFEESSKRGEVVHYGHTPMVYLNKYGLQTELEPAKKSLTDALKKCLSMLGFSADIFLGDFDDQDYVSQMRAQSQIDKAENRESEIDDQRTKLTDYVTTNLATLTKAITVHEVVGIEKSCLRYLGKRKAMPDLSQIAERGMTAIAREADAKRKALQPTNDNDRGDE